MTIHFHRPSHTNELFSLLIKGVGHVHDWLAGPAMSEHDRVEGEIAKSKGLLRRCRIPLESALSRRCR